MSRRKNRIQPEDVREKIIELLERHRENCEKLQRYHNDEMVREWQKLYLADGRNLKSELESLKKKLPRIRHYPLSLAEALENQKALLIETVDQMEIESQLVKILLLNLGDLEERLISLRYFEKLSISKVCEVMFLSRSTFYRRHEQALAILTDSYRSIFYPEEEAEDAEALLEDDVDKAKADGKKQGETVQDKEAEDANE